MYINIHSHRRAGKGEWGLRNFSPGIGQFSEDMPFSAGIHPWHIPENWQGLYDELARLAKHPNLMAIGECGLDKICNTDMHLQRDVFIAQIKLANEIDKPLIIHCVRAYEEVLQALSSCRNEMPVIFHGFNKSEALAQSLVRKGFYLSFGAAVKKVNIASYIPRLPLSRIFLETDDADISISEVYKTVADVLNISEEALSLQLQRNLQNVFKI
ncbi:MAG: TatD family hydrolase [Niabella sp.]